MKQLQQQIGFLYKFISLNLEAQDLAEQNKKY